MTSHRRYLLEASVHSLEFFAGELCDTAELVNTFGYTPYLLQFSISLSVICMQHHAAHTFVVCYDKCTILETVRHRPNEQQ